MLKRVAEGVLTHESEFIQSNTVVVQGEDGLLLIDVDAVIPGHGSVGTGGQVRSRIDQDRTYVRAVSRPRNGRRRSGTRSSVANVVFCAVNPAQAPDGCGDPTLNECRGGDAQGMSRP